jgi:heme exporter protein A
MRTPVYRLEAQAMTDALISATGLGIMRGERVLFDGVSVEALAGEAVVLRGSNGAGKTTLLRILAGLTQAGAGDVARPAKMHWIGHRDGLKPNETPAAHLALWASAWGAEADIIPNVLERVGLTRAAEVSARFLSAGQRRRVGMARLLLDARALWLLDEPYAALDGDGRALMLDLIAAHRASGGAVVAAIHGAAGFPVSREVAL